MPGPIDKTASEETLGPSFSISYSATVAECMTHYLEKCGRLQPANSPPIVGPSNKTFQVNKVILRCDSKNAHACLL